MYVCVCVCVTLVLTAGVSLALSTDTAHHRRTSAPRTIHTLRILVVVLCRGTGTNKDTEKEIRWSEVIGWLHQIPREGPQVVVMKVAHVHSTLVPTTFDQEHEDIWHVSWELRRAVHELIWMWRKGDNRSCWRRSWREKELEGLHQQYVCQLYLYT